MAPPYNSNKVQYLSTNHCCILKHLPLNFGLTKFVSHFLKPQNQDYFFDNGEQFDGCVLAVLALFGQATVISRIPPPKT